MNFATGYSITTPELFTTFSSKKFKTPFKYIKQYFKDKHINRIAARVFTYAFYLIIKDIIQNNVTFRLPIPHEAYIEMKKISGDNFVDARKRGAFKEIDYLASNFCGYHLQYRFARPCGSKEKLIYVDGHLKQMLIDNTNSGMKYY